MTKQSDKVQVSNTCCAKSSKRGGCGADSSASVAPGISGPDVSGPDAGRRAFLRGAVAAATVTLAPGVMLYTYPADTAAARPLNEPVSATKRWGMLIDVAKCKDGCTSCVTACATEHGWDATDRSATSAQWIRKVKITDNKTGVVQTLPMLCQHCTHPPCVDVCPTGASFKRADGIVLVDKHTCIGCRYCMMACPYNARSFIHESLEDQKSYAPRGKGTVESCTLCVHRVDKDQTPACVEACAKAGHSAMIFGDLNDASSEIAKRIAQYPSTQIRADLGVDPGVRYQNL